MTTKAPDSAEKAIHWSAHRDDDIELRCHPERDLFGFQDQARRVADYLAHVFPQLPRGPVTTALQRERSASLTAHGEALGGLEGRRRSVLLSILGERGAGKSSMMDLIVFEVLEEQRRQDPVCFGSKPPLEVRYNAWINANRPESVWLRVAEHIGEELFNRLRVRLAPPPPGVSRHFLRVTARGPNGEVERQVEVSKVEVRLSWREVALRVSRAVHAAFAEGWGPEFSLFTTPHSYLPGPGLAPSLPRAAPGIASRGLALAGALAKDGPSGFLEVAASAVKDTQRMLEEAYVCAAEVPPADSSRFLDLLNTLLDKVGPKPRTGPRIILRLEDVGRLDDRQLREFSAVLPMLERRSDAVGFIDYDLSRMTIEGSRAPDSQERPITRLVTLRERPP
ncbi:MAG: hypothetical protein IPN01_08070 [Deltaproteobacteria bacterium]|nr:hypothetical protein [Deltaproteobacteria bacterium]